MTHNQNQTIQQQQQNQNVYIAQQIDNNAITKNQMIIGSNGQQLRIIQQQQNPSAIICSDSSDYHQLHSNAVAHSSQLTPHPIVKLNEIPSGSNVTITKRTQNILNASQIVQIHEKREHQTKLSRNQSSKSLQHQQHSSLDQLPKIQMSPQQNEIADQALKDENYSNILDLPIGVQLPNGMVQVHQNCDINQIKNPAQTILIKTNSNTNQQSPQSVILSKLKEHQYNIPLTASQPYKTQNAFKTRVLSESPVSSSTVNKLNNLIEIQTNANDKGPAQVGAISTSNESPPISNSDTSIPTEFQANISSEFFHFISN